jgi:hypothetical protein
MPYFPSLPEIKHPQLFKGDIPSLLKDIAQLKRQKQLSELSDITLKRAQREEAAAPSVEEIRAGRKRKTEAEEMAINAAKLEHAEGLIDLGLKGLPGLTLEGYDAYRKSMVKLGAQPEIFPDMTTEEELEKWKEDIRQETLLWKQRAGKGTKLNQLYEQLDAETNPTRRKEIQSAIQKEIGKEPETEEITLYHIGDPAKTRRVTRIKGRDDNIQEIYGEEWTTNREAAKKARATETERQIDIKLWRGLRGLTHDESGAPLDAPSSSGIESLNKTAQEYGREIVKISLPFVDVPGIFNIKAREIYMLVEKGKTPTKQDVIEALVTDYGMDEEDAKKQLEAMRNK